MVEKVGWETAYDRGISGALYGVPDRKSPDQAELVHIGSEVRSIYPERSAGDAALFMKFVNNRASR